MRASSIHVRRNSSREPIENHSDCSFSIASPWRRRKRSSMLWPKDQSSFTLRKRNCHSSSWIEWLRFSDRKIVTHTTEMILWSMILSEEHVLWDSTSKHIPKILWKFLINFTSLTKPTLIRRFCTLTQTQCQTNMAIGFLKSETAQKRKCDIKYWRRNIDTQRPLILIFETLVFSSGGTSEFAVSNCDFENNGKEININTKSTKNKPE